MKKLSDKLVTLFNFRIKAELESAYLYEAMANCLAMSGFINASKVWRKDAEDERTHAKWAMDYMILRDVHPITPTIEAPKEQKFKDLKDIIDQTTEHEYVVTTQCNDLAKAAVMESDLLTYQFVSSKYLAEQQEELERCMEMQRLINLYGNTPDGWIGMEDYFAKKL
jgi:ferritin